MRIPMGDRVPARRARTAGGGGVDHRPALPDQGPAGPAPARGPHRLVRRLPPQPAAADRPAPGARATRSPASPTCSTSGSRAAASTPSSASRPSSTRSSATSTPSCSTPAELLDRFPDGSMTPELMQRAAALGLVELDRRRQGPGPRPPLPRDRLAPSPTSASPLDVILDEWEALVAHTDDIAERFITIFETAPRAERLAERPRHRRGPRPGRHARPAAGHRPPGPGRRPRRQRRPRSAASASGSSSDR